MSFSIKIIDVKALDNFILHVCFNNGIKKSYDVKQLFDRFPNMFYSFKDNPAIFKNVKIIFKKEEYYGKNQKSNRRTYR